MYTLDEDDGNYWIYRLMIDGRFQGRGYGNAALTQIIELISKIPLCPCVALGVHPENEKARRLYEHVGFRLRNRRPAGFSQANKARCRPLPVPRRSAAPSRTARARLEWHRT